MPTRTRWRAPCWAASSATTRRTRRWPSQGWRRTNRSTKRKVPDVGHFYLAANRLIALDACSIGAVDEIRLHRRYRPARTGNQTLQCFESGIAFQAQLELLVPDRIHQHDAILGEDTPDRRRAVARRLDDVAARHRLLTLRTLFVYHRGPGGCQTRC